MFTFRPQPNESEDNGGRPFIRTSPSLSELSVQAIPWPSNLVDLSQLPQDTLASPPRGAAKTLFMADAAHPVPFHKAWSSPGKATDSPTGRPITPLYISSPSSTFETRKSSHDANFMTFKPALSLGCYQVAGAQGVGKTSALLSIIDTPGLDFREGHELKLERQVSTIVKYLDLQFADTLTKVHGYLGSSVHRVASPPSRCDRALMYPPGNCHSLQESKVVHQSKGDQHIHLCIYMINPSSVLTEGARRAQSSYPTKVHSEVTVSYKPPDLSFMSDDTNSEDEENKNGLTTSTADIRVMCRIAVHANVLPVIARADSLMDAKLAAVKKVVRRDLAADLDFGVFGPVVADDAAKSPADERANGNWNGHGHTHGTSHGSQRSADDAAQAHSDSSRPAGGTPEPSQENEKSQKEDTNDADQQQQQQQQQQQENDNGEWPIIKLQP
ncbi:hypothetical protein DICSQDRAFT_166922, partial [Dichomitus squalens LYAD-421 SS1]|uniref:uncharacterized protein n=1 Tax=Dichomitus squalens (strain LYAD-421) TaxID=732165 RepID=UPI0004415FA0